MALRIVVLLAPLVLLGGLISDSRNGSWDAMRAAGFGLVALGLVLMFIARLQLGDSFSITPQAHRLVSGGIYSVVRHPVYVTGIMAMAGLALYVQRPVFLAAVAILALLQFRRSKAEERVLEAKFGQEYRDYRSRTWF